ncbi:MAG: hypothetical protein P8M34_05115, partial [Saprospiraceae bacterium]|nr:hypothetical protein [Saprospiraceae bacterium]
GKSFTNLWCAEIYTVRCLVQHNDWQQHQLCPIPKFTTIEWYLHHIYTARRRSYFSKDQSFQIKSDNS